MSVNNVWYYVLFLAVLLNGCAVMDGRTVGEISSDAAITSAVNSKFLTDDLVSAITINVDTNRGVVTLKGTVDTLVVARRAYDLAYSVEGVTQVISRLTIRSEPMTPWGPVSR